MDAIFISGVSSGIGHALASAYLDRGNSVFGVSRRAPDDLLRHGRFAFRHLDLTEHGNAQAVLGGLLDGVDHLELAVLNAGVLGRFGDMAQMPLDELKQVMEINLWSNKTVLDCLLAEGRRVDQVVTISSGASVNGNRGWAGYALSKAALNMLTRLYARENPDTHFCALAPGVIDTPMLDGLLSLPADGRYPSLDVLRSKRHTPDVPTPAEAAQRLVAAIDRLPGLVESGSYADLRKLPEG